jgi:hypothetical protein
MRRWFYLEYGAGNVLADIEATSPGSASCCEAADTCPPGTVMKELATGDEVAECTSNPYARWRFYSLSELADAPGSERRGAA